MEIARLLRADFPRRMEKILGWKFLDKELMTGLPEYRNGPCTLSARLPPSDPELGSQQVDFSSTLAYSSPRSRPCSSLSLFPSLQRSLPSWKSRLLTLHIRPSWRCAP